MWDISQIIAMNKEPVNDDTPSGIYLESCEWKECFLPDPLDPNYVYEPRTR